MKLKQFLPAVLVVAVVSGSGSPVAAQTTSDGRVWLGLSLQQRPSKKSRWRGVLETQARSRDGLDALEQWFVRPSIGYDVTTHATVSVGYAYFRTTPASGGALVEQRLWQQVLWSHPAAGGTFSSRSRLERRDLDGNDRASWRIREQLRFSRPIHPRSDWSVVVWDEVSAHLTETRRTARGIDQNRVFAGMSVVLDARARIEFGYQNQFVYSSTGAHKLNHIFSGVLTLSLP